MGISIREFETAMEMYGAKKLPNETGTRYNVSVPCFKVANVKFKHSGSYYIVQYGVSDKEWNNALKALNEEHPGKINYWWGEIHSIRGVLTLASILDNKYSKEYVDELTNLAFEKLIKSMVKSLDIKSSINYVEYPKEYQKILKKVREFDYLVCPFIPFYFENEIDTQKSGIYLKTPSKYLDDINLTCNGKRWLTLETEKILLYTSIGDGTAAYDIRKGIIPMKNNNKMGGFSLNHYMDEWSEQITLYIVPNLKEPFSNISRITVDLINAKICYKNEIDETAKDITDEEIKILLGYLQKACRYIKRHVYSYMIEK